MKRFAFAFALLAACSGFAKTFDVDISTGRPAASNEAYYQGETIEFRAVRGKSVVTNVEYGCIYYQTNGMEQAWWHTDGLVFHPTNDVGAASYRFFLEGRDDLGRDWHANGLLRLLPSPGFTPNVLELPIQHLDFAAIDYVNDPWLKPAATNELSASLSSLVSRSSLASTNYTDTATNSLASTLRGEIAAAQPADYATVSNKAMTAVQPGALAVTNNFVKKSGDTVTGLLKSSAPLGEAWEGFGINGTIGYYGGTHWGVRIGTGANSDHPVIIGKQGNEIVVPSSSGTMALASEIPSTASEVGAVPTSRTVNGKALSANISLTASDVGAATAADVYRIVAGTNVVLVITNYNSAVHAPSMKLQHLDPQSGQYVTYWDEQRRHGITLTNAMQYADAVAQTRAPAAWSGTTSGLGAEAPAGVTWISTPETVIAGGYEYEKVATTAGAVWVLSSNGLSTGATTNSFFRIAAADGTEIFSIEKTDSYLVGVSADDITRSGNTVTIPVNVVAPSHPYIRATTNLVNAVWTKEDENGFSCPWASVTWSGSTGAYVATVTCAQPQAFFYFEFLQEGSTKIKQSAKTELSGGIIFNGVTYMPTVSGNELKFIAQ